MSRSLLLPYAPVFVVRYLARGMIDLLRALNVGEVTSEIYAPILADACPKWEIDEPRETAAFLANCVHESGHFSRIEENLNYSAQALRSYWPKRVSAEAAQRIARKPEQIANVVYANRMGNGDYDSGDGWAYRGRGLIQVTGRANYQALSFAWGVDCIEEPEKLTTPLGAVVSACWFWKSNGCNELAQALRWRDLCVRINGGLNGYSERMELLEIALNHFGES